MKVYIFTDNANLFVLEILKTLLTSNGNEVEVVTTIHHLNPEIHVIISTGVYTQSQIFQRHYGNNNIYFMIDNKIQFYEYISRNMYLCNDHNISLIPNYNRLYTGPSVTKNFMVKAANGFSCKFNEVIHGNVYDLINKYSNTHQIQDILDVKNIYGVSVCCKFGKILAAYSYLTQGTISTTSFHAERNCEIRIPEVRNFLKDMVANLQLHGIIEVEFIIHPSNKIYLMECNPRISGSIRVPDFYNSIIRTYLRTFCDKSAIGIF